MLLRVTKLARIRSGFLAPDFGPEFLRSVWDRIKTKAFSGLVEFLVADITA